MNDNLKQNIKRMEKELAKMKQTLEARERNWPDKVVKGMVFKHCSSGCFCMTRADSAYGDCADLVVVGGIGTPGNYWNAGKGFNGQEKEFTYIGMARDVMTIKDTTK